MNDIEDRTGKPTPNALDDAATEGLTKTEDTTSVVYRRLEIVHQLRCRLGGEVILPCLLFETDGEVREHVLRSATRVGRGADAELRLQDPHVSKLQFEIKPSGDAFILTDLSSKNGTFVNTCRVYEHTLTSGDIVKVGSTLMVFLDA